MVHFSTQKIKLPHLTTKIRSISRNAIGGFLLDGGIGHQNSYHGIDDYINTTSRSPYKNQVQGTGLADKIGGVLRNLNLNKTTHKPRVKNIQMSL
jgi:hypothetical protein